MGGGSMRDKAQRPGIGREEQVEEAPGGDRPTRNRTAEESTRRREDERQGEHEEGDGAGQRRGGG
ncbi:hypothetical protein ABZ128_32405 [Streptomyces sp. NPDC006326]|uniref:hypothetical protein n=1 Tax=Streptomyces sp. NPDC006326 TaxID=3156752 RepID=UPI0033BBB309